MTREKLTERTLIPIGLVGGICTILVGFVMWLTTMHNEVQATSRELLMRKELDKQVASDVAVIKNDIAEIKGELRRIKR